MSISKEQLMAKKAQLEKDLAQLQANFNATNGALQVVNQFLAELEVQELPQTASS